MEAVGQLAGGIAHDFHNTLTAILGFGGLMKMKMADDDPNRPYLEEVLQAGSNATKLVQGLLAFSRKQLIKPERLDLAELLQRTRKMLQKTIREDIELRILPAEVPLTVMADEEELAPGGTETILLADDEPGVSKVTRIILESAGYRVLTAADGEEALALFLAHQDQIKLAILDVVMPKLDGKALADLIHARKPATKILFFSGYTASIIQSKGILSRHMNFLAKPVPPTELLKKVRELLDTPGG